MSEQKLITIEEIKEKISKGVNIQDCEIEFKKYLPVSSKRYIVEQIIDKSLIENNEIFKINYIMKTIILEYTICKFYTNINLDVENAIEIYDYFKENGIIEYIFNNIPPNELSIIFSIIDEELQQSLTINNSIEVLLAKSINKIVLNLPDNKKINGYINKITKTINKMDLNKIIEK